MDLEDILAPPGGVGSRQAFDAVVATPAPASVSSALFVTVPALDGGRSAIECRWQGVPGSLPGVGDRCLLVETSDGDAPTFWATGFDGRDVPLNVASGTDPRLTDARTPTGTAGGALAGTYPNPTLAKRRVVGAVNADGTVAAGSGFTVTKNATGDYTVTFSSAFPAAPVVVPGVGVTVGALAIKLGAATTTTTFRVFTFTTTTGTNTDAAFQFTAEQP